MRKKFKKGQKIYYIGYNGEIKSGIIDYIDYDFTTTYIYLEDGNAVDIEYCFKNSYAAFNYELYTERRFLLRLRKEGFDNKDNIWMYNLTIKEIPIYMHNTPKNRKRKKWGNTLASYMFEI